MFFHNVCYQWRVPASVGVSNVVILPSQLNSLSLKGKLKQNTYSSFRRVIDPQLYCFNYDLQFNKFSKLLCRLASYSWFGIPADELETKGEGITKWERDIEKNIKKLLKRGVNPLENWEETVRRCVEFQLNIHVERIILPATLICDPESSLEDDLARLDIALDVISSYEDTPPILASIPIEDTAIHKRDFVDNPFIEAICDAYSARDGISGYYIPYASQLNKGPSSRNTAGAIMRISNILGEKLGKEVYLNFVDSLGLLCLGIGASAYATGYATKERGFCIKDYKDRKGGPAFPKFLSLQTCFEYNPDELDKLAERRLLHFIDEDRTEASNNLFEALLARGTCSEVQEWRKRPNNIQAAKKHYAQIHIKKVSEGVDIDTLHDWIVKAEVESTYINKRFEDDPLKFQPTFLASWRSAFDYFFQEMN